MTRAAVAVGLVLVAAVARAQVPAGGEFRVNSMVTGSQVQPRVSVARHGEFVVVWSHPFAAPADRDVRAQRYDATGAPAGGEFAVNTTTVGYQGRPEVGMDGSAAFVVVWESQSASSGLIAQRFGPAGQQLGGEFRVNENTFAGPTAHDVAVVRYGSFIVVWHATTPTDPSGGVFARIFRRDGTSFPPGFGDIHVNNSTLNTQVSPAVAADVGGRFVVAWEHEPVVSEREVNARLFFSPGGAMGLEFLVNSYTTGRQIRPVVARAPLGGFVVAWDGQDGSGYGVRAQRFGPTGVRLGPEFSVNSFTADDQSGASIAMDETGGSVVAWTSNSQDGSDNTIVGQRFDAQGVPRGAEFIVNTYTTSDQLDASVSSDAVGNFTVTWSSYGQDGSGFGVFGQRFGGLRPIGLRVDPIGNGIIEPGETTEMRPTWRNDGGATQIFSTVVSDPGGSVGAPLPQIVGAFGAYAPLANGASAECTTCPVLAFPSPQPRPVLHWDATVIETVNPDAQGQRKIWTLHVGASFADVSRASPFYRFIETMVHYNITGGCTSSTYCPLATTSREQMAPFVLIAQDPLFFPPDCGPTPMFADVPSSNVFCRYIEELARRGVVAGCGNGNYCPLLPVTREQMAVFVLRTLDGTLNPPPCGVPMFNDVPSTSPFCRWIEELARRNVVTGCGGGNYCPQASVTREQMSVFLSVTFGLTLYAP